MKVQIKLAKKRQSIDCLNCIKNSKLWDAYFKSNEKAEGIIRDRIKKKQIYVATTRKGKCIGLMGIIDQGCFGSFSYLSILAVKQDQRGKGIGKKMLCKFEKIGFKNSNTIFLLVSDFNNKAKILYKSLGYREVGSIPNLFKKGITELILMKQIF